MSDNGFHLVLLFVILIQFNFLNDPIFSFFI